MTPQSPRTLSAPARRARRRTAFALGVACTLLAAASPAQQDAAKGDPNAGRLLRNVTSAPTNPITSSLFSAGVRNCAARIDQVTNFLMTGTLTSALLFVAERDPDAMIASVSMEVQGEGTPRAYASASFAPGTAIGCGTLYESIQYWSEPCNAVATRQFKGATANGTLGREIAILTIGPNARVFLMRAGSGCVSIKKEVLG